MWSINPRERLCQEVLGSKLSSPLSNREWDQTIISIPTGYADISVDVLFTALEAVYDHSPVHIRQMLPFVLDSLERNRSDLFVSGYFDAFFLHVNYDFSLPIEVNSLPIKGEVGPRYSQDYRQNWIAPNLSAMNRFEHGWAFEWARNLLQNGDPQVVFLFEKDLTMFCRILAMALGKPENEAPAFQSCPPIKP